MIEEFIHTPEGRFISKDPYDHYTTVGNKVRMINAVKAEKISCRVKQDAIGEITETCASENNYYRTSVDRPDVRVRWPQESCTINLREAGYGEHWVEWYCDIDCVEPVYD